MTHDQRVDALKAGSLVVAGFGVLCTLALVTPASLILERFFDLAFLSWGTQTTLNQEEGRLVLAILGGITAGWGAMFWMIADRVFRPMPEVGGPVVLTSVAVWFCVDGTGSVLAGAPFNVVLNLVFVALLTLPVVWPLSKAAPT